MKKLLLLSTILLLSACGQKLDGTYTEQTGMFSYTFKSNGTMIQSTQSLPDAEVEVKYEVDGNKVKLLFPQLTIVATLLEDGAIQAAGFKLIKQK